MYRKTIDLTMRLQTYLFISFPKCGYFEARFPFNLKFTFPEWPSSESPNPVCVCVCVCVHAHACVFSCFSHVRLFVTPRTVACQAPLSMGFSRLDYWSGLPCSPPGDLPDLG